MASAAQVRAALEQLQAGQKIRLVLGSGRMVEGTLRAGVGHSDQELELELAPIAGGPGKVRRVEIPSITDVALVVLSEGPE